MWRKTIMWLCAAAFAACGTPDAQDGDWELTEEKPENNGDSNNGTVNNNGTTDENNGTTDENNGTTELNNETSSNNGTNDGTNNVTASCLPSVPEAHRAMARTCDRERADFEPMPDPDHPFVECTAHADCTAGVNGRCIGNSHDGWYCSYDACFSDSECTGGAVCECQGGFRSDANVCLQGNCVTDADCGDTGFCSPSMGDCGDYFGTISYFCHTCDDECVNDADCGGSGDGFGDPYCAYNPGLGRWTCSNSHCAG